LELSASVGFIHKEYMSICTLMLGLHVYCPIDPWTIQHCVCGFYTIKYYDDMVDWNGSGMKMSWPNLKH